MIGDINMKKKRCVVIFGTVIIMFLMVSNVTAINVNENKFEREIVENKKADISDEIHVDPNIKLTRKHLPKLKFAIEQIDNIDYKLILQKSVEIIEKQDYLNSEDIEEILIELSLKDIEVHTGKIFGLSSGLTFIFSWPYLVSPTLAFWMGPAFYVTWGSDEDGDFIVGILQFEITGVHLGFALTPIGFWSFIKIDETHAEIGIFAWSPLILIFRGEYK